VVAFDPAVAEAEAENEVLAAAPVAPDDGEAGLGFHDHVVLVQLGVHGVDLPLSEGIVKCLVDG
jgi:hypothetical protein